jgi:hypothetical protein
MKILFYGSDGAAAKAQAAELRAAKTPVRLVHAEACNEAEPCDGIDFMPDVSKFDRARLIALFDGTALAKEGEGDGGKPALHVGKKDDGKFYILNADESIHSGPFDKKADAKAALAKEVGE